MESFAKRLAKAMEYAGINQNQLANKSGVSRSQISRYLTGERVATQTPLHKLALCLGVSEAWLMGCEDVPMLRVNNKITDTTLLTETEASVIKVLRSLPKEKQDLIITLLGNLQDD